MNNTFYDQELKSYGILEETYEYSNLKKIYHSQKNTQSGSSQGLNDNVLLKLNSLFKNQNILKKDQLFIILLAFLGGYFTFGNPGPEYRIDKSATKSIEFTKYDLNKYLGEITYSDPYIEDQPEYSHNEAISLAERNGISINFKL